MQSQPPKGKGKVAILAVAVALLVLGGLVAYSYAGTRTTSSTSLSSKVSSATGAGNHLTFVNSTISSDGLQLAVALNTTSLLTGKGLSAQVYLTNTLPRNVSLPANLTAFPGDPALEALGRGYQCDGAGLLGMLNFGLYQGHYMAANFSQAVPLTLEAPVAHTCPNPYYYVQSNQSVEFAPNSDRATLSGQKTTGMHMSLATVNCTTGTYTFGPSTVVENGSTTTLSAGTGLSWGCGPAYEGVRGYWTLLNGTYITVNDRSNSTILQSLNAAYGLYRQFSPGPYTVVAEDYWNQTVFAHFEVRASLSSSATVAAACFVSVPAGSQQGDFANSTFNGDKVTFPNGTSVLFSNYSCPRPIFGGSNQGANLTKLAVAAVTNSTFLSVENGSEFLFLQPGGLVCSTIGSQNCSMTLYFYHYGANSTLFRCGGGLNSNNAQMLYRRDALAGLTVTFYTTSPATNNEVNSDTPWDLQHPVIQAMSPDQLMITYDNSYPCG